MSEEEKAIKFLQICAEGFANDEKIENIDNPFLFAKAIIERQQKEIEKLKRKKYILNAETNEIKEIPIDNNYISKDKIREKIKEIDEDELLQKIDFGQISLALKVLYELLDDKN